MFPKSTEIVKNIPKNTFYEKAEMTSSIKKKFKDYVVSIYLINKLSKDTLNIKPTKNVEEIFVFEIKLKDSKYLDKIEDVLSVIDKSIPYPILFVILVDDKEVMCKIAYKQRNKVDSDKSVVDVYLSLDKLVFGKKLFNSLNLEIFYERLLRLFLDGYDKLGIAEAIYKYKNKLSLTKELEMLEKNVIQEKQSDRQYELHQQIKSIKKDLKNYN
jgi:hypothetical protein